MTAGRRSAEGAAPGGGGVLLQDCVVPPGAGGTISREAGVLCLPPWSSDRHWELNTVQGLEGEGAQADSSQLREFQAGVGEEARGCWGSTANVGSDRMQKRC